MQEGNRKRNSEKSDSSPSAKFKMNSQSEDSHSMNIDNSFEVNSKIASLYSERLMCDVILVVGTTEYPSHRLILCASSDVFQAMFSNAHWSESQEKRIELKETTPACANVFEEFLRYLYTGKIQFDHSNVFPLVILADKYNVKGLLKIGLDFMVANVAIACKKNQLASWLQFSIASGHKYLEKVCRNFMKWNFNLVSNATDFSSIDPDILISLLECHDIVVVDEFKLFECVFRWIEGRHEINRNEEDEDELLSETEEHFNLIVKYIRFPMMSPGQLANLLLFKQITKPCTDLLVDKIRLGLSYHNGSLDLSRIIRQDRHIFTPRLYSTEKFCASLSIDHLHNLQSYHCRSLLFSSQKFTADFLGDDQTEWFVDVYPKGVWFQRCLTVYRPSGLEVPERVLNTVRVTVSTRQEVEQRVRIGILIVGEQDRFEHIKLVKTRNYIFDRDDQIVNFDDVVDIKEISGQENTSNFLTGPNRQSLKVFVVITPLSKFSQL